MIKGNTFAATAFFSYGAFWMAYFVHNYIVKSAAAAAAAVAAPASPAFTGPATFVVGETLIMALWGVFTFLFWVPTLRKNGCLCFVFGSLFMTFFLLAGGQWSKVCLSDSAQPLTCVTPPISHLCFSSSHTMVCVSRSFAGSVACIMAWC